MCFLRRHHIYGDGDGDGDDNGDSYNNGAGHNMRD
jgi:hypothetical protein